MLEMAGIITFQLFMAKYKKKNIALGALGRLLLSERLWTHRFTWAWLGCLLSVLAFDLLWCWQTSFRGMGYVLTYVNALTLATLMALPAVLTVRNWVQMAVMAVVDVVFVANLMYCRTYYATIPLDSYARAWEIMSAPAAIWDSFHWIYFIFPLILLLTFILMVPDRDEDAPSAWPYLLTLGTLSLLSGLGIWLNGGLTEHISSLRSHGRSAYVPPVAYTVFGPLVAEYNTVTDEITPGQRQMAAMWGKNHMRYMARMQPVSQDSVTRRDNLVFIVCESLESWPVGKKVEGQEITPNINALLRDSTTFYAPRVLSQAANGRGVDGELLMLAGMHPARSIAWTTRFAENDFFTLPKAMKEQDASTYIVSGSSPGTWNRATMARSFGIDNVMMGPEWNDAEKIGSRISDGSLMRQTVAMLRRGEIWKPGEGAYLQVNTASGAAPFRIPRELSDIRLQGSYPRRLKDYLAAVNYTDQAVGTLLDYLRTRPDWDRTMVVIAGNHEALASWRYELRSSPAGQKMVDAGSYVPLVIVNAPFGGRHDAVMGQVDVYSTVLDQMGLPYRWRGMGFSALSPGAPRFAVTPQGTFAGRDMAADPGLARHVDEAREASDLILRYNLLDE